MTSAGATTEVAGPVATTPPPPPPPPQPAALPNPSTHHHSGTPLPAGHSPHSTTPPAGQRPHSTNPYPGISEARAGSPEPVGSRLGSRQGAKGSRLGSRQGATDSQQGSRQGKRYGAWYVRPEEWKDVFSEGGAKPAGAPDVADAAVTAQIEAKQEELKEQLKESYGFKVFKDHLKASGVEPSPTLQRLKTPTKADLARTIFSSGHKWRDDISLPFALMGGPSQDPPKIVQRQIIHYSPDLRDLEIDEIISPEMREAVRRTLAINDLLTDHKHKMRHYTAARKRQLLAMASRLVMSQAAARSRPGSRSPSRPTTGVLSWPSSPISRAVHAFTEAASAHNRSTSPSGKDPSLDMACFLTQPLAPQEDMPESPAPTNFPDSPVRFNEHQQIKFVSKDGRLLDKVCGPGGESSPRNAPQLQLPSAARNLGFQDEASVAAVQLQTMMKLRSKHQAASGLSREDAEGSSGQRAVAAQQLSPPRLALHSAALWPGVHPRPRVSSMGVGSLRDSPPRQASPGHSAPVVAADKFSNRFPSPLGERSGVWLPAGAEVQSLLHEDVSTRLSRSASPHVCGRGRAEREEEAEEEEEDLPFGVRVLDMYSMQADLCKSRKICTAPVPVPVPGSGLTSEGSSGPQPNSPKVRPRFRSHLSGHPSATAPAVNPLIAQATRVPTPPQQDPLKAASSPLGNELPKLTSEPYTTPVNRAPGSATPHQMPELPAAQPWQFAEATTADALVFPVQPWGLEPASQEAGLAGGLSLGSLTGGDGSTSKAGLLQEGEVFPGATRHRGPNGGSSGEEGEEQHSPGSGHGSKHKYKHKHKRRSKNKSREKRQDVNGHIEEVMQSHSLANLSLSWLRGDRVPKETDRMCALPSLTKAGSQQDNLFDQMLQVAMRRNSAPAGAACNGSPVRGKPPSAHQQPLSPHNVTSLGRAGPSGNNAGPWTRGCPVNAPATVARHQHRHHDQPNTTRSAGQHEGSELPHHQLPSAFKPRLMSQTS